MREIKFRLWSEIHGVMLPPITLKTMCECAIAAGKADFQDGILMQYTGSKDKNGVEIYEGDIVAFGYDDLCYDFVVSMSDAGCFIAHDKMNKSDCYFLDDFDYVVIGNIHQNPELLGK